MQKERVNEPEELQALLSKGIKALKSLITFITDHLPKGDHTKETPSFLGFRVITFNNETEIYCILFFDYMIKHMILVRRSISSDLLQTSIKLAIYLYADKLLNSVIK